MKRRQHIFPDLTTYPVQSLSDVPVELDGQEVIFDEKISVYPVNLVKKEEQVRNGRREENKYHRR